MRDLFPVNPFEETLLKTFKLAREDAFANYVLRQARRGKTLRLMAFATDDGYAHLQPYQDGLHEAYLKSMGRRTEIALHKKEFGKLDDIPFEEQIADLNMHMLDIGYTASCSDAPEVIAHANAFLRRCGGQTIAIGCASFEAAYWCVTRLAEALLEMGFANPVKARDLIVSAEDCFGEIWMRHWLCCEIVDIGPQGATRIDRPSEETPDEAEADVEF